MIFRKAPERWVVFPRSPGGYSPWHPGFGLHCRPNPSSSRCGLQLSQDRIEVGFRQCESFGDGGPRCLKRVFGCGLIPGLGDVVQWILCSLGHKCHSWNQSFFNWSCLLQELNDPFLAKSCHMKIGSIANIPPEFLLQISGETSLVSRMEPRLSHGSMHFRAWHIGNRALPQYTWCWAISPIRKLGMEVCHLKKTRYSLP